MNDVEAEATFRLLHWFGYRGAHDVDDVNDIDAAQALITLANAAWKASAIGGRPTAVLAAFAVHGEKLRGTAAAERVCEALDRHAADGGLIPGTVIAAFTDWRATREAVEP